MNRLNVDTLTPDLLAGPTYELMRGSCTSLTELDYHLEEVYKATTDQLDWINPEGQQYPHNLLQPLPLIPDNRGRRVIPFYHFINNDLEYLRGGASSRKYTTSVTKTKAADYGYIKWIEDLVPRAMWIQQPIDYNRHALWGVSHWGRKRQQFYGYVVNRESALDDTPGGESSLSLSSRLWNGTTTSIWIGFWYVEHCHPEASERSSTGSGKLPEKAQPYEARHGIRIQYLSTTIWRRGDKDRAAAMIQAIEKMLKTRRIMRSLEKFVGGRLYEGDLRMLQRTK
nr:hypothetical protein [Tanacetum cinerariifolium]